MSAGGVPLLLLVEDSMPTALLVTRRLEGVVPGVRVAHARTLSDAMTMLEPPPACVLLDLNLPDSAGVETVARLRAHAPDVPIVVLTGSLDEAAGPAAVAAGAQRYLDKGSADGDALWRAVRDASGRSVPGR